jgi:hypothetical protein
MKETEFHISKMKSILHHYQDNDLNSLQIKKSKHVILFVVSRSKEDLSFSFLSDDIEYFCTELFALSQAVNITLKLV